MNIFESIFINSVFILFPLFCYFLFVTHQKSCGKKTSNILFDIAIYTSLYLILKYGSNTMGFSIMLMTIPLLIVYLKNKIITAIFISISIFLYYYFVLDLNIVPLIIEFIVYAGLFFLFNNKKNFTNYFLNGFIITKISILFFEIEHPVLRKYGSLCLVIWSIFYILTVYFVHYLLKKAEASSKLTMSVKELERQKQIRDSLFKITHEIKNPLAVCKGYLDMLDIKDQNQTQKYIPIVQQEINRTLTLLNDFSNLTKLSIDKKELDISILLQDICESLKLLIKSHNIKFECYIFDDEVYLKGDYNRLKQVFINVIKNSIEAIPSDRQGIIKLNAIRKNKCVVVKVEDNGVGINKKVFNKIGEPFFTTKKGGTGLGVLLSKEIIEAHGGKITYKSIENIKTTVKVIIPI